MTNYKIWTCNDTEEEMVEILNECDIQSIQKEFIEKGYIIISICRGINLCGLTSTFMSVEKKANAK